MQSIIAGDLVLVTGATGYVAAHVIDQLLKKGYRVRGTVRSLSSSKTDYLRSRFQEHTSNLELVEATDLEADGVFDQACISAKWNQLKAPISWPDRLCKEFKG